MWLIDRKTGGQQSGADGPQTAAYLHLHERGIEVPFDEASHIYTAPDGTRPLSVTGILARAGLYKGIEFFTQEARILGEVVHQYCEFYDRDELDETEVDPMVEGYLESWKKFRIATGFKPLTVERPMYSPAYRFAGKADVTGTMNDDDGASIHRGCVYLQEDGRLAKWVAHNSRNDWSIFLAALTLANWKLEKGL